jgi:hypothetical protein
LFRSLTTFLLLDVINVEDILELLRNTWDSKYDRDYTDIDDQGERLTRGGVEYHRPYGWKRFAMEVIGKYKDDAWLGSNNGSQEWPVSYYGTGHHKEKSMRQAVYDTIKRKRSVHEHGIYSTPKISLAKAYAKSFTVNSQKYIFVFQIRINPKTVLKLSRDETGGGEYWISPDAADVRQYGICVMDIS